MSEPELDLRAELARIDRDRAETLKLMAERQKLLAESHRFDLNRYEPWKIVATAFVIGSALVILSVLTAAIVVHLMRHLGL